MKLPRLLKQNNMQSVSIICFLTFVIKGKLTEGRIFETIQRDLDSNCDANDEALDSSLNAVDPNQQYMPTYGASNAVETKSKREPQIQDGSALRDVKSTSGEADQFDPLNDVANQMLFENSNPMVSETKDTFNRNFEPMGQTSYGTSDNLDGQLDKVNSDSTKYSNSLFAPNEIRLRQIMEFNSNSPKNRRFRRAESRQVELSNEGNSLMDLSMDSLQEPFIINRKLSMLRNQPAVSTGDNIRKTRKIEASKNRRSLMYGMNTDLLTTTDYYVKKDNEESAESKYFPYTVSENCGCPTTTKCTTPCTTKCTTPCTTKGTTACTTPCTTKCTTPCTTPCTTKCTTPCTTPCTTKGTTACTTPSTTKCTTPCTTPCTTKGTTPCTTPCTTPTTKCTTPCPKKMLTVVLPI